jgi:hypothetical protein
MNLISIGLEKSELFLYKDLVKKLNKNRGLSAW